MMPVDRQDPPADDQRAGGTGPEAFFRLREQLDELVEYGWTYVSARADAIVVVLRRLGLLAVVALVALVIFCAMLATATVVGIVGLALLVGEALGSAWAGYAVTGFGLLALTMISLLVGVALLQRRFRRSTKKKYERRHQAQRARFGRDVTGAAGGAQRS